MPKISELREKAGLTQRDLAIAVGVTDTTIANWEHGRRGIEWLVRTAKLCEMLNCQPSDLYELKEIGDESSNP